ENPNLWGMPAHRPIESRARCFSSNRHPRSNLLSEHDLFRKPASTFRGHALTGPPHETFGEILPKHRPGRMRKLNRRSSYGGGLGVFFFQASHGRPQKPTRAVGRRAVLR